MHNVHPNDLKIFRITNGDGTYSGWLALIVLGIGLWLARFYWPSWLPSWWWPLSFWSGLLLAAWIIKDEIKRALRIRRVCKGKY
jgi:hypothetical protein